MDMKKIGLIIMFLLLNFMVKAQTKYAIAEITYLTAFGKVQVIGKFDDGNGKKAEMLKDSEGSKLELSSIAEMLNIICAKGYKVQSFVREKNNSSGTSIDYIFIFEKL